MADGVCFEDLQVGQTASTGKTITEADILMFAAVSTDTNPVHIDAEAAAGSRSSSERIAHGMLSAGLISAVLGTQLPGPGTIYMRQTLRFRAPVKIGDTVTATVEVTALRRRRRSGPPCSTVCTVGGKAVIEGEADGAWCPRAGLMRIFRDWRGLPRRRPRRHGRAGQFRRRASRPRPRAARRPCRAARRAAGGADASSRIRASCSAPTIRRSA